MGYFSGEEEAARAFDQALRRHCHEPHRLKKSLNFPSTEEEQFAESQAHARARGLASSSACSWEKAAKSLRLLQERFQGLPQAAKYDIIGVPNASRVDAILQPKNSNCGGVQIQLKASTGNKRGTYCFGNTHGYDGMLLIVMSLHNGMMWAMPGCSVTQKAFTISSTSKKFMLWRVTDLGSTLEKCFHNQDEYPHITLQEARMKCAASARVEEHAHLQLSEVFSCRGLALRKPLLLSPTVDSVLAGPELEWRIQEKACNPRKRYNDNKHFIDLRKRAGAFGYVGYASHDFDVLVASILMKNRLVGFFLIPISALLRRGLVGQRPITLALHPPWALPKLETTQRKYEWQLEYFVDLRDWLRNAPLPWQTQERMLQLLRVVNVEVQNQRRSLTHT